MIRSSRWLVRVSVFFILMLRPVGAGLAEGAAAPPGKIHLVATVDGMQMTVWLAQASYPRSSLVAVHLKIVNTSSSTISLGPLCPYGYAWAEVDAPNGRVLYPPAISLPGSPDPICPPVQASDLITLTPGFGLSVTRFVILRNGSVRAGVTQAQVDSAGHINLKRVASPFVAVPRTAATKAPYKITFDASQPRVEARLVSRASVPLWFQSVVQCHLPHGRPDRFTSTAVWRRPTFILRAPCNVDKWRLVVASPGNLASIASYSR